MLEFPLLFRRQRDEIRFTAPLPGRVGLGGMWYYRLALSKVPGKQRNGAHARARDSRSRRARHADVRRSRALGARRRHQGGQDLLSTAATSGVALDTAPTWRGSWDDTQVLPILIRIEVTPRKGAPWPPLVVAPRAAPEAGCRAWDTIRIAVRRSVTVQRRSPLPRGPQRAARATRHRAHHRAVAHDHADGHRERLRVLDAQRGAVGAQRAVARAGARGGRRRRRAHGVRAVAAALSDGVDRATASRARGARATSRSSPPPSTSPRKIDLNAAPDALLKGLLEHVAGTDPDATAEDRRRDPGLARSGRRQAAERRGRGGLPHGGTEAEARQRAVRDRERAVARDGRHARDLRAHRRQPHRAFAAARRQRADRVARRAARAAQRRRRRSSTPTSRSAPKRRRPSCRCRRSRRRRGFVAGAVPVWRIRAIAAAVDGVTFVREAVVRPSGDGRRPLLALSWQEGSTATAPAAIDASAGNEPSNPTRDHGRP